jgi:hypothetical protein
MNPIDYFKTPNTIAQKQYEALRMYFVEDKTALEVAHAFGYTHRGFTTIVTEFTKQLKLKGPIGLFFKELSRGRKKIEDSIEDMIIELRKSYYSVEDIKVALDSKGISVAEKTIYNVIKAHGFARLPRRQKLVKKSLEPTNIRANKTISLDFTPEHFSSSSVGLLCLLPYIKDYGISDLIQASDFPQTSQISRLSSILAFVALKASNVRRYSADDLWCMDRGLGLFAGLNVLPKAAWFSSYSHNVTPAMNLKFLRALHNKWLSLGILGDTVNMDFTTIPYWGQSDHLENNWSGKRTKALASMLAVLAQDADSGIIDYGSTNVLHKNESGVVLEFLDFYRDGNNQNDLKYLVFDSKFTNYKNLDQLDNDGIKFITIRRRGKNIVERLNNLPKNQWKTIRVERTSNKSMTISVLDEKVFLRGYDKEIRMISITGHGKIKPATIITNDFDITTEQIVRKYARRWLVEKTVSEQIEFFHLNHVSSSMVIKVDFDLVMSILTYNLFRLFALDTDRYKNIASQKVYEKFLDNSGHIEIEQNNITIKLKKKRTLPLILETMTRFEQTKYDWLDYKTLTFSGATNS